MRCTDDAAVRAAVCKEAAERRVRAAACALEKAESDHTAARAEYEARYSLLRRAFKDLGTRTSAYRAEHVTPREENLSRAQADFDDHRDTVMMIQRMKAPQVETAYVSLAASSWTARWQRAFSSSATTVVSTQSSTVEMEDSYVRADATGAEERMRQVANLGEKLKTLTSLSQISSASTTPDLSPRSESAAQSEISSASTTLDSLPEISSASSTLDSLPEIFSRCSTPDMSPKLAGKPLDAFSLEEASSW